MNKILVDTNILICAADQDSIFHSPASELLTQAGCAFYTSSKNLSEFLAVITKGTESFLSVEEAVAVIQDFQDIFKILYPTHLSFYIFKKLLLKYKPKGLKIHDAEIADIALANGIHLKHCLLSEHYGDKFDNPSDFLKASV